MKKYLFLLITVLFGLSSCGDDDKIEPKKLNKLTRITCYKNSSTTPLYMVDITYSSNGDIYSVQKDNEARQLFIYTNNLVTINGPGSELTTYTIRNNFISEKTVSKENPYIPNEAYNSDIYTYVYNGTAMREANWKTTWPKTDGSGYESRSYAPSDNYTWESGAVIRYNNTRDPREMVYEYGTHMQPANFPFRVINSFNPTGFEVVDPMNLYYGYQNIFLPSRAYVYEVPGTSPNLAEYTYSFNNIGDYITNMTIIEEDRTNGSQTNTYVFAFEYNYEVK